MSKVRGSPSQLWPNHRTLELPHKIHGGAAGSQQPTQPAHGQPRCIHHGHGHIRVACARQVVPCVPLLSQAGGVGACLDEDPNDRVHLKMDPNPGIRMQKVGLSLSKGPCSISSGKARRETTWFEDQSFQPELPSRLPLVSANGLANPLLVTGIAALCMEHGHELHHLLLPFKLFILRHEPW